MSRRTHGRPLPSRPDTRPLLRSGLIAACWRGELPAEALDTSDREWLIGELHRAGWADVEIAAHTKLSTYTVGRIRERLGIEPNATDIRGIA